jgi:L-ascorbate metabolism protein UlaG (beta-lactamase superfamily)
MKDNFPTVIEEFEAQEGLTIWALGGPSVAIRTPQSLIYLDLFTGPAPSVALHKATVDIIDPEIIRRVDAVLCTHHDLDHCHEGSLTPIHANTEALLIGPRSCTKLFRKWGFSSSRLVELSAGQGFQLKDLRIWALPCNDYFDPDAISYVLQSGGITAFEGGDTLYYSGYIEVGRQFEIDVALLNFARNPAGEIYYMNHAHVARTAEELGARMVIPKHYDLWEEFLDDPGPLAPMLEPKGIKLQILNQGEYIALSADRD